MPIRLSDLPPSTALRFDTKAVLLRAHLQHPDELVPLCHVADIQELPSAPIPTETFEYVEISSVDNLGISTPYVIDPADVEPGSEEERILKKASSGDISSPPPGSILVPKVRPHLGKFLIVSPDRPVFYTRAFLAVRPKTTDPAFLYALLKHPATLHHLANLSVVGKGYPTISSFSLGRDILVPRSTVTPPADAVDAVVHSVGLYASTVAQIRPERTVIDAALLPQLHLDPFPPLPTSSYFQVSLASDPIPENIRCSPHFLRPSTEALLHAARLRPSEKLGRLCTLPIALGTSPPPAVPESDFYYLGPNAMTREALDTEMLMPMTEDSYRRLAPRFGLQRGDVLLRRSGASLGKTLYFDSELPCIYSDFTMRLRFSSPEIGRFASYWLRTSILQALLDSVAVVGKGLRNIYPSIIERLPLPDPEVLPLGDLLQAVDDQVRANHAIRDQAIAQLADVFRILDDEFGLSRHLIPAR